MNLMLSNKSRWTERVEYISLNVYSNFNNNNSLKWNQTYKMYQDHLLSIGFITSFLIFRLRSLTKLSLLMRIYRHSVLSLNMLDFNQKIFILG